MCVCVYFSLLLIKIRPELSNETLTVSGLAPRIIKVAPACAIMISSYEFFKTLFYNRNLQQAQDLEVECDITLQP